MRRRRRSPLPPRAARVVGVAATLAVLAVPGSALAHTGQLGSDGVPIDIPKAITHDTVQAVEVAVLPRETPGGECLATRPVTGVGDACRTVDGLLRIPMAAGGSVVSHGSDAPRADSPIIAALPHLPATQDALDGASIDDITCVSGASDRRLELIYAYPAGGANNSAAVIPALREAIYGASAFLDAEAQALDPTAGRRLRALCSGGDLVVHVAQVRAEAPAGAVYSEIVDDLVAQGFPAQTWNSPSHRRFAVFYDGEAANGAAGQAALWLDERAAADNINNQGGRYAIEYDWTGTNTPTWDVMLHEITHNMGGAQDLAPASSGAGHCNDGLDVLCYGDGGPTAAYSSTTCAQERYDCGGDTYFHPAPAPGSYLAGNWNIGSTTNSWLEPRFTGWDDGGVPDTDPPSAIAGLTVGSTSSTQVVVSWQAATDTRSAVRYHVEVDRLDGATWQLDSTATGLVATTFTLRQLVANSTYRIRVHAYDQAGNHGAEASVQASTVEAVPTAPASVGITAASSTSVDVAWAAGSAGSGVWYYDVQLRAGSGTGTWYSYAYEAGTSVRIGDLEPGRTYQARVRTVSNEETVSAWRISTTTATLPGGLREDGGGGSGGGELEAPVVRVASIGQTGARATWSPGSASSWTVQLLDASKLLWTRSVTAPTITLTGLRPRTAYTLRVVASSADASSAAALQSFTTARDTTAPSRVVLVGRASVRGGVLRATWRAATDASGIARYEVQRRSGSRWVRVRTPALARSVAVRGASSVRVRAVDRAGNVGAWTTAGAARRRA